MNIFLVPHNWTRFVVVGVVLGGVALIFWWLVITSAVLLAPTMYAYGLLWPQWLEGPFLLATMAGAIGFASLFVESSLRRLEPQWRVLLPVAASLLAGVPTLLLCLGYEQALPYTTSDEFAPVLASASTVTLRYRLFEWMIAGFFAGLGPAIVRLLWSVLGMVEDSIPEFLGYPAGQKDMPSLLSHLVGGVGAAMLGAGTWHILNHMVIKDLYLAFPAGVFVWALVFGLVAWGVPSDLYAGWIRVLSSHRFGLRIPIDRPEGGPAERVMGHYPLGLDIFVGAEHGVAELHTSFVVDADGHYGVRGLSQQPTKVKRSLESIDLRYDPSSPVPLETGLGMEDIVVMGPKGQQTLVEFILLPKEEQ